MQLKDVQPISGHVFWIERSGGPVWFAKYRLPDGRQVKKRIGPAWTHRGRPAAGYFTKRTADEWLRRVLDEARAGTVPGTVRTRVTLTQAADEWLRHCAEDRTCKPSAMREYRKSVAAHLEACVW